MKSKLLRPFSMEGYPPDNAPDGDVFCPWMDYTRPFTFLVGILSQKSILT
jgi:hypothetical protein